MNEIDGRRQPRQDIRACEVRGRDGASEIAGTRCIARHRAVGPAANVSVLTLKSNPGSMSNAEDDSPTNSGSNVVASELKRAWMSAGGSRKLWLAT